MSIKKCAFNTICYSITINLKSKYYKLSQKDGLTQLMNKSSGINAFNSYLSKVKPHEHFAVLFLDLDNFKSINDTYGHLMGDKLLKAVSEIFHADIKPTDDCL